MSAQQSTSLVQRKARTGREAQAARAMSLGRALRLTAAKQADHLMGLAASALSVTRRPLSAENVGDFIDPAALTLLMDGPGNTGAAAMLHPALVTGLIQQQTTGRVKPVPAGGEARTYTATDAALCAPFIEALLARAATLPEEQGDRDLLQGYRFGVWAKGARQAQLALDAPGYEVVEMVIDMAAGTRAGTLSLILPKPQKAQSPSPDPDADMEDAVHVPSNTLADQVLDLTAELTVALTRLRMPLQNLSAIKPGDVLDLEISSMAQALVLDSNGRAISRCILGQIDGFRAVQVEQRNAKQHTAPRRRADDRHELGMPDVTAPAQELGKRAAPEDIEGGVGKGDIPSLADIDIFGDMQDLDDLPDIDAASAAADETMARWDAATPDETEEDKRKALAGR
jgi:flagellar motor switch/type III secretory pathway protein FliN